MISLLVTLTCRSVWLLAMTAWKDKQLLKRLDKPSNAPGAPGGAQTIKRCLARD